MQLPRGAGELSLSPASKGVAVPKVSLAGISIAILFTSNFTCASVFSTWPWYGHVKTKNTTPTCFCSFFFIPSFTRPEITCKLPSFNFFKNHTILEQNFQKQKNKKNWKNFVFIFLVKILRIENENRLVDFQIPKLKICLIRSKHWVEPALDFKANVKI